MQYNSAFHPIWFQLKNKHNIRLLWARNFRHTFFQLNVEQAKKSVYCATSTNVHSSMWWSFMRSNKNLWPTVAIISPGKWWLIDENVPLWNGRVKRQSFRAKHSSNELPRSTNEHFTEIFMCLEEPVFGFLLSIRFNFPFVCMIHKQCHCLVTGQFQRTIQTIRKSYRIDSMQCIRTLCKCVYRAAKTADSILYHSLFIVYVE